MAKTWNKKELDKAVELRNQGYTSNQISRAFGGKYSAAAVRRKLKRSGKPISTASETKDETYNNDGVQTSSAILTVLKDEKITPDKLLEAHGFDKDAWDIVNAKSNFWKQTQETTSYQTKISVKPKIGASVDDLIDKIVEHKKPYKRLRFLQSPSSNYLVIPAMDTHFNGETLPQYEESLQRALDIISSKRWNDTLLILGGDLIHVDNVNSTTTKGTQLETTDLCKAVDEAQEYFETIICCVMEHSNHLQIQYDKGNHDATTGYMLARLLERAYSNQLDVDFNVDLKKYKAYMLGNNFIASTHGDKGKANYIANFASRFSVMWGNASNHELFTGHLHSFKEEDLGGFIHRQVSTRKPTDDWTDDLGVVSTKFFQLVEYDKNETRAVYYV